MSPNIVGCFAFAVISNPESAYGIAQVLNGVNVHLADLLFWQIGFGH